MKKIKVQRRLPFIILLLVSACFVFFLAWLLWISTTAHGGKIYSGAIIGLTAVALMILPIFVYIKLVDKNEYVSELIIVNGELRLIYRVGSNKITKVETIHLNDISSIMLLQNLESYTNRGNYKFIKGDSETYIYLTDGSTVYFKASGTDWPFAQFDKGSPHKFLLNMLAVKYLLPNFSYKLSDSSFDKYAEKDVERDIEHYMRTGKRYPLYKTKRGKILIACGVVLLGYLFIFLYMCYLQFC